MALFFHPAGDLMPSIPMVRVTRSGLEESVHDGDLAVVDAQGRLVAFAGEPDRALFPGRR